MPFTLVINEEKVTDETIGVIHMYFEELPQVIGYGEDIEQAKKDFVFALKDYASIYMDDLKPLSCTESPWTASASKHTT